MKMIIQQKLFYEKLQMLLVRCDMQHYIEQILYTFNNSVCNITIDNFVFSIPSDNFCMHHWNASLLCPIWIKGFCINYYTWKPIHLHNQQLKLTILMLCWNWKFSYILLQLMICVLQLQLTISVCTIVIETSLCTVIYNLSMHYNIWEVW